MIRVWRDEREPPALARVRAVELPRLRARSSITSEDIEGYRVARNALFQSHFFKCCYCEQMLEEKHRPVEHFRPKSIYWWLSFTWENLLFSCESCNEHKSDRFPLQRGKPLAPEQTPPGRERPLLLDPSREDPIHHIQFRPAGRQWLPFPRSGSRRGAETIRTCRLDRGDLLRLYQNWTILLGEPVQSFRRTLEGRESEAIRTDWSALSARWLSPRRPFAALAHDLLDHHFPAALRRRFGLSLSLLDPEHL